MPAWLLYRVPRLIVEHNLPTSHSLLLINQPKDAGSRPVSRGAKLEAGYYLVGYACAKVLL
jgi:hypothetical protein